MRQHLIANLHMLNGAVSITGQHHRASREAVWTRPKQTHRATIGDCAGVCRKHVGHVVGRLRMVGFVQTDGLGVMVNGHIDVATNAQLNAS
jgi:hypothetical protein